jgi:tetratricopeptide (TPR) repeat protein
VARAAHAAHCAGEHHRAVVLGRRTVELADGTGDAVSAALARERLGIYLWAGGDSDAALASYADAEGVLPAGPPTQALARLLAAKAEIVVLRGPAEEALAVSERALAAARAAGSRTVEAHTLDTLGMALSLTGDRAGGERALREAIRIAEELSDDFATTRAYISLGDCVEQQGRIEEASAIALEGASMADRAGVLSHARYLMGDACWRLVCLGRLDEAEAIAERALAATPKGMPGVLVLESAAYLALRLGRLGEAEERFAGVRDLLGETSDSMWLGTTTAGQAEVALWRSDP